MKKSMKRGMACGIATMFATGLVAASVPGAALAASDSQTSSSGWYEIWDMRPEEPNHSYHWKIAATLTVTQGTVTGLTMTAKANAGGGVPEMEEPYYTPVKKIFESDVPDMGLKATDYEAAVDGIDTISGATQTTHWAKEALKDALRKWNENNDKALPVVTALDALNAQSSSAQVTSARAGYNGLGAKLQDYVPLASYKKLTDAEAAAKPAAKKAFVVNVATVSAGAVKSAAAKAGATPSSATSITVGTKAKKISKGAFKGFSKVKTLDVRSTKLTKKGVKGSLSGSAVKTVKVPKSKKAAYKKIFTKANAGKKVTVK